MLYPPTVVGGTGHHGLCTTSVWKTRAPRACSFTNPTNTTQNLGISVPKTSYFLGPTWMSQRNPPIRGRRLRAYERVAGKQLWLFRP